MRAGISLDQQPLDLPPDGFDLADLTAASEDFQPGLSDGGLHAARIGEDRLFKVCQAQAKMALPAVARVSSRKPGCLLRSSSRVRSDF